MSLQDSIKFLHGTLLAAIFSDDFTSIHEYNGNYYPVGQTTYLAY